MKVTGKIEVFKNKNGYNTGIIPSIKDKKLLGKSYIQVRLPEVVNIKEGETWTLDVTEGYLNSVHVEGQQESFEKLVLSIAQCSVVSVYPEPAKQTKKVKKA